MPTIRQRGDSWQAIVRLRRNGVLHAETRSFASERLARDWAKRAEQAIRTGGGPLNSTTIGNLINKFRTAREEVKPMGRSMHSDLDMLDREFGAVRTQALTSATVAAFARRRRSEGAGPATVLHNLATLRTVLSAARPMFNVDCDATPVADAIKSLSLTGHVAKSLQRDRRPTAEELDRLVKEFERTAAYPQTKIPMTAIVRLCVALPRRISELCTAEWANYAGGVLTLIDTKHPRVPRREQVPVPPQARNIIEALPKIDALILPYKAESVCSAFARACERLGIDDLHLHDLRHEGICRLFERGLNIPEVSMVSGHLSWATLKRYTHLMPHHVLERLDARP